MSVIVLILFLAFFAYLGSPAWRRDGMRPRRAGGGAAATVYSAAASVPVNKCGQRRFTSGPFSS